MRENSAPKVNSAPTTTGSIKSSFSCYCNNNQYINSLPKSIVNCWCINYYCNRLARKTRFHWASCCRGRVYPGAEFSRMYGKFRSFVWQKAKIRITIRDWQCAVLLFSSNRGFITQPLSTWTAGRGRHLLSSLETTWKGNILKALIAVW